MKKFFKGLLKGFILSILGIVAFMWLFSFLFPRAYNVLEGKVLGIKEDSVITVVQNKDTLAIAKPKEKKELPKLSERSVKLEHKDNCYYIPTKVNGIPMKMLLDTGASHLTLSIVEYEFMRKQGLIVCTANSVGTATIANGETVTCYSVKIDELTIGDITIKDVDGTIMPQQDAPALLGMDVLRKMGNFSIDYNRNLLIFKD